MKKSFLIYAIYNTINIKCYIESTNYLYNRNKQLKLKSDE